MTAAENTSLAPRASRAFKFLRKRDGENYKEFYPCSGTRLHFANRDVDTLVAQGIPEGLLQCGDKVFVQHYESGSWVTVFAGEVDRIVDRHGRGTDRVQDVTVAGPWSKLSRLVFRQSWSVAGAGTNGDALTISSSRVILNQKANGASQSMKEQLDEILDYACPKCGITKGTVSALAQVLPADEARDITCADAIRRELRFFPKRIVRFNYANSPSIEIIDTSTGYVAGYVASAPKTERVYEYNAHPVSCVDVCVDTTDILVSGERLGDTHQIYPSDGDPDDLDCLHVTVPLERGSASTTTESFESVTEDIPGNLNLKSWWMDKHPRLAGLVAEQIDITNAQRLDAGGNTVTSTTLARIAKSTKGEIEAAGLHCAVHRFTCDCKIETPDDEEENIKLSMDFLVTDATGTAQNPKTYTWQTGSSYTAGETLPANLAQALFEQRSQSLLSERMTIRLGDEFPKIGDMDVVDGETVYLQSFDVDCYDLAAQLSFGQPEHLCPEDMKSLLNGFRQRGYATTAKLRKNKADEDADEEDASGGIPPISSSEWSPGVKVKTVIKQAAANRAASSKRIFLDSTAIPSDCKSGEIAVHTFSYLDENGDTQVYHGLLCDDIDLSDLGKIIKSAKMEPVEGGLAIVLKYTDGTKDTFDLSGLQGAPGSDGQDGDTPEITAEPGAGVTHIYANGELIADIPDGKTPEITASKDGKVTTIYADGRPIAWIDDGEDGGSGSAIEVVTGISFAIKEGRLVATVSKSTVNVLGEPETATSEAVDVCGAEDVTVVTSEDYSPSTHRFTNRRTKIKVLSQEAAGGQTPFIATPLSGE
jgi:hypothetical protein